MENTLRTVSDICTHFGVDVNADLSNLEEASRLVSRRVYKSTECGAWAVVEGPGTRCERTRPVEWTLRFSTSILGTVLHGGRPAHGTYVQAADLPANVREYAQAAGARNVCSFELDSIRGGENGILRVTRSLGITRVTCMIDTPVVTRHAGCLLIGSIVEGSDAEVAASPLYLPFTVTEMDLAIDEVDAEASRLWDEANGPEANVEVTL